MRRSFLFVVPLLLCTAPVSTVAQAQDSPASLAPEAAVATHGTFETYWYQGLAEMSRYTLSQSRYGESHQGEAVFIYVTEDFDTELSVKWDHGPRDNVVPVLKLNAYRRFYTGVYPYTLMTSTFTPTAEPGGPALKVTHSAQEWCGSSFQQLNRRGDGYRGELHSYFQSEGDRHIELDDVLLEDALWNHVRQAPDALPTGELTLVPAMHYLRLLHRPTEAVAASASLGEATTISDWSEPVRQYTVRYTGLERRVDLWFEAAFPHRIVVFEESSPPVFGSSEPMTTRGVLTNSILLDYWSRNGADDGVYRELLGLEH